ncbi:MAG: hypothetical protein COV75_03465, partial [Candidatus Omnitrophica bacterium CG11_big_fil_rev_8_21_14_0_20_63_9]
MRLAYRLVQAPAPSILTYQLPGLAMPERLRYRYDRSTRTLLLIDRFRSDTQPEHPESDLLMIFELLSHAPARFLDIHPAAAGQWVHRLARAGLLHRETVWRYRVERNAILPRPNANHAFAFMLPTLGLLPLKILDVSDVGWLAPALLTALVMVPLMAWFERGWLIRWFSRTVSTPDPPSRQAESAENPSVVKIQAKVFPELTELGRASTTSATDAPPSEIRLLQTDPSTFEALHRYVVEFLDVADRMTEAEAIEAYFWSVWARGVNRQQSPAELWRNQPEWEEEVVFAEFLFYAQFSRALEGKPADPQLEQLLPRFLRARAAFSKLGRILDSGNPERQRRLEELHARLKSRLVGQMFSQAYAEGDVVPGSGILSTLVGDPELRERLAQEIGEGQRGKMVLSVGLGSGVLEEALRDRWGLRVTGVDVSDVLLRRAKERQLAVAKADGQFLPVADASVDIVVIAGSIGYMDIPTAISEAYRVLKPGGIIHVTSRRDPVMGYVGPKPDEFLTMFREAGFGEGHEVRLLDDQPHRYNYFYVTASKPSVGLQHVFTFAPLAILTGLDLGDMSSWLTPGLGALLVTLVIAAATFTVAMVRAGGKSTRAADRQHADLWDALQTNDWSRVRRMAGQLAAQEATLAVMAADVPPAVKHDLRLARVALLDDIELLEGLAIAVPLRERDPPFHRYNVLATLYAMLLTGGAPKPGAPRAFIARRSRDTLRVTLLNPSRAGIGVSFSLANYIYTLAPSWLDLPDGSQVLRVRMDVPLGRRVAGMEGRGEIDGATVLRRFFSGSAASAYLIERDGRFLVRKEARGRGRQQLLEQLRWLQSLPPDLAQHFPEIHGFHVDDEEVWMELQYYPWPSIPQLIHAGGFLQEGDVDEELDVWPRLAAERVWALLHHMYRLLRPALHRVTIEDHPQNFFDRFHGAKIAARLAEAVELAPSLAPLLDSPVLEVDGHRIVAARPLLELIRKANERTGILDPPRLTVTHGDLNIGNILVNPLSLGRGSAAPVVKLVDPRGWIDVSTGQWLGQDPLYDFTKMVYHQLTHWELIRRDVYEARQVKPMRRSVPAFRLPHSFDDLGGDNLLFLTYGEFSEIFHRWMAEHDDFFGKRSDVPWQLPFYFTLASILVSDTRFAVREDEGSQPRAVTEYVQGTLLLNRFWMAMVGYVQHIQPELAEELEADYQRALARSPRRARQPAAPRNTYAFALPTLGLLQIGDVSLETSPFFWLTLLMAVAGFAVAMAKQGKGPRTFRNYQKLVSELLKDPARRFTHSLRPMRDYRGIRGFYELFDGVQAAIREGHVAVEHEPHEDDRLRAFFNAFPRETRFEYGFDVLPFTMEQYRAGPDRLDWSGVSRPVVPTKILDAPPAPPRAPPKPAPAVSAPRPAAPQPPVVSTPPAEQPATTPPAKASSTAPAPAFISSADQQFHRALEGHYQDWIILFEADSRPSRAVPVSLRTAESLTSEEWSAVSRQGYSGQRHDLLLAVEGAGHDIRLLGSIRFDERIIGRSWTVRLTGPGMRYEGVAGELRAAAVRAARERGAGSSRSITVHTPGLQEQRALQQIVGHVLTSTDSVELTPEQADAFVDHGRIFILTKALYDPGLDRQVIADRLIDIGRLRRSAVVDRITPLLHYPKIWPFAQKVHRELTGHRGAYAFALPLLSGIGVADVLSAAEVWWPAASAVFAVAVIMSPRLQRLMRNIVARIIRPLVGSSFETGRVVRGDQLVQGADDGRLTVLAGQMAHVEVSAFTGKDAPPGEVKRWKGALRNLQQGSVDPGVEYFFHVDTAGRVDGMAIIEVHGRQATLKTLAAARDGRGRGTRLLETVLQTLQDRSVDRLSWYSSRRAIRFYHRYLAGRMDYETGVNPRWFSAYVQTKDALTRAQMAAQQWYVRALTTHRASVEEQLERLEGDYMLARTQSAQGGLAIHIAADGTWSQPGRPSSPDDARRLRALVLNRLLSDADALLLDAATRQVVLTPQLLPRKTRVQSGAMRPSRRFFAFALPTAGLLPLELGDVVSWLTPGIGALLMTLLVAAMAFAFTMVKQRDESGAVPMFTDAAQAQEAIRELIHRRLGEVSDRPIIVRIDGPPATGKTSIAAWMKAGGLGLDPAQVVLADDEALGVGDTVDWEVMSWRAAELLKNPEQQYQQGTRVIVVSAYRARWAVPDAQTDVILRAHTEESVQRTRVEARHESWFTASLNTAEDLYHLDARHHTHLIVDTTHMRPEQWLLPPRALGAAGASTGRGAMPSALADLIAPLEYVLLQGDVPYVVPGAGSLIERLDTMHEWYGDPTRMRQFFEELGRIRGMIEVRHVQDLERLLGRLEAEGIAAELDAESSQLRLAPQVLRRPDLAKSLYWLKARAAEIWLLDMTQHVVAIFSNHDGLLEAEGDPPARLVGALETAVDRLRQQHAPPNLSDLSEEQPFLGMLNLEALDQLAARAGFLDLARLIDGPAPDVRSRWGALLGRFEYTDAEVRSAANVIAERLGFLSSHAPRAVGSAANQGHSGGDVSQRQRERYTAAEFIEIGRRVAPSSWRAILGYALAHVQRQGADLSEVMVEVFTDDYVIVRHRDAQIFHGSLASLQRSDTIVEYLVARRELFPPRGLSAVVPLLAFAPSFWLQPELIAFGLAWAALLLLWTSVYLVDGRLADIVADRIMERVGPPIEDEGTPREIRERLRRNVVGRPGPLWLGIAGGFMYAAGVLRASNVTTLPELALGIMVSPVTLAGLGLVLLAHLWILWRQLSGWIPNAWRVAFEDMANHPDADDFIELPAAVAELLDPLQRVLRHEEVAALSLDAREADQALETLPEWLDDPEHGRYVLQQLQRVVEALHVRNREEAIELGRILQKQGIVTRFDARTGSLAIPPQATHLPIVGDVSQRLYRRLYQGWLIRAGADVLSLYSMHERLFDPQPPAPPALVEDLRRRLAANPFYRQPTSLKAWEHSSLGDLTDGELSSLIARATLVRLAEMLTDRDQPFLAGLRAAGYSDIQTIAAWQQLAQEQGLWNFESPDALELPQEAPASAAQRFTRAIADAWTRVRQRPSMWLLPLLLPVAALAAFTGWLPLGDPETLGLPAWLLAGFITSRRPNIPNYKTVTTFLDDHDLEEALQAPKAQLDERLNRVLTRAPNLSVKSLPVDTRLAYGHGEAEAHAIQWLSQMWHVERQWIWHQQSKLPLQVRMELTSRLLDRLVDALHGLAHRRFGKLADGLAFVALGSHARRELLLNSDVDLRYIAADEAQQGEVLQFLSQITVKVFGKPLAVLDPLEKLDWESVERSDHERANAAQEARYIRGDPELWTRWYTGMLQGLRRHRLGMMRGGRSQWNRHYMEGGGLEGLNEKEFDVKEAVGGIREYQMAHWIALSDGLSMMDSAAIAQLVRASTARGGREGWTWRLRSIASQARRHRGISDEHEEREARGAYMHMLRVRAGLEQTDRLTLARSASVAQRLGYDGEGAEALETFRQHVQQSRDVLFHFAYKQVRVVSEQVEPPRIMTQTTEGLPDGFRDVTRQGVVFTLEQGWSLMPEAVALRRFAVFTENGLRTLYGIASEAGHAGFTAEQAAAWDQAYRITVERARKLTSMAQTLSQRLRLAQHQPPDGTVLSIADQLAEDTMELRRLIGNLPPVVAVRLGSDLDAWLTAFPAQMRTIRGQARELVTRMRPLLVQHAVDFEEEGRHVTLPGPIHRTLFDLLRYVARHGVVLRGTVLDALERTAATAGTWQWWRLRLGFGRYLAYTDGPLAYGVRRLRSARMEGRVGGVLGRLLPGYNSLVYQRHLDPPHRLALDRHVLKAFDLGEALLFNQPELAGSPEGFVPLHEALTPALEHVRSRGLIRALRLTLLLHARKTPLPSSVRRVLRALRIATVVEGVWGSARVSWTLTRLGIWPWTREHWLVMWAVRHQRSLMGQLAEGLIPGALAAHLHTTVGLSADRFSLLVAFTLIDQASLQPERLNLRLRDFQPVLAITPDLIQNSRLSERLIAQAHQRVFGSEDAVFRAFMQQGGLVLVRTPLLSDPEHTLVELDRVQELLISYRLPNGVDRPGLLEAITGALTAERLDIVEYNVGLEPDGRTIDRFAVRPRWQADKQAGARTAVHQEPRAWKDVTDRLEATISTLLSEFAEASVEQLLKAVKPTEPASSTQDLMPVEIRRTREALSKEEFIRPAVGIPTSIGFRSKAIRGHSTTSLRVRTAHFIGVLEMLSAVLAHRNINIVRANGFNEGDDLAIGERATHTLSLTQEGKPLDRAARQELRSTLRRILRQPVITQAMWQLPEQYPPHSPRRGFWAVGFVPWLQDMVHEPVIWGVLVVAAALLVFGPRVVQRIREVIQWSSSDLPWFDRANLAGLGVGNLLEIAPEPQMGRMQWFGFEGARYAFTSRGSGRYMELSAPRRERWNGTGFASSQLAVHRHEDGEVKDAAVLIGRMLHGTPQQQLKADAVYVERAIATAVQRGLDVWHWSAGKPLIVLAQLEASAPVTVRVYGRPYEAHDLGPVAPGTMWRKFAVMIPGAAPRNAGNTSGGLHAFAWLGLPVSFGMTGDTSWLGLLAAIVVALPWVIGAVRGGGEGGWRSWFSGLQRPGIDRPLTNTELQERIDYLSDRKRLTLRAWLGPVYDYLVFLERKRDPWVDKIKFFHVELLEREEFNPATLSRTPLADNQIIALLVTRRYPNAVPGEMWHSVQLIVTQARDLPYLRKTIGTSAMLKRPTPMLVNVRHIISPRGVLLAEFSLSDRDPRTLHRKKKADPEWVLQGRGWDKQLWNNQLRLLALAGFGGMPVGGMRFTDRTLEWFARLPEAEMLWQLPQQEEESVPWWYRSQPLHQGGGADWPWAQDKWAGVDWPAVGWEELWHWMGLLADIDLEDIRMLRASGGAHDLIGQFLKDRFTFQRQERAKSDLAYQAFLQRTGLPSDRNLPYLVFGLEQEAAKHPETLHARLTPLLGADPYHFVTARIPDMTPAPWWQRLLGGRLSPPSALRVQPGEAAAWKPVGSRAEVETFAEGSIYPRPLFHGTIAPAREAILREGFRTDVPIRARRWAGRGVYLESQRYWAGEHAEQVAGAAGELPAIVEARAVLRNPKRYGSRPEGIAEVERFPGVTYQEKAEAFRASLQQAGHDGVLIQRTDGGAEVVAFEERQVMVVTPSASKGSAYAIIPFLGGPLVMTHEWGAVAMLALLAMPLLGAALRIARRRLRPLRETLAVARHAQAIEQTGDFDTAQALLSRHGPAGFLGGVVLRHGPSGRHVLFVGRAYSGRASTAKEWLKPFRAFRRVAPEWALVGHWTNSFVFGQGRPERLVTMQDEDFLNKPLMTTEVREREGAVEIYERRHPVKPAGVPAK